MKELTDFYVSKRAKDNRQSSCIKCSKKYYKDNIEKVKAYGLSHRLANKDKINARGLKYYANNKEKVNAANKSWRIRNKGTINALTAKRRALAKKASPAWADKELIKDMYIEAKYQNMQVDHIIPLQSKTVCGLHWEGNLQLLTASENQSKGNRYSNGA